MRRCLALALTAALLAACAPTAAAPERAELTVAAAANVQFAFTDLGARFEQQTGQRVTFIFGSTSDLARQIENGAPYDLFAAADTQSVDGLAAQGLVLPDSLAVYGRGRVVLAVNTQSGVRAASLADLLDSSIAHIAIANPDHAPYGLAAKEALQSAGLWDQIQPKLVLGENVRQTLQYVQTGDAQAGIVALSIAGVPEITWTLLDEDLHNPLDQALGVVASSQHIDAARQFAAFINSADGRPVMQQYGFVLPGEIATGLVTPTPAP